jgi:hypothetical protein
MNHRPQMSLLVLALASFAPLCSAAEPMAPAWQYSVPFETGKVDKAGQAQPGQALLWLPPRAGTLRGLLVGGQLGIELEIALAPSVRQACTDCSLGIVYFVPHVSALFHYWEAGNTDTQRFLKALDNVAEVSGHAELRRVPWITMGHSTAGIFCRNVAYWKPERVAGIVHIKSGNFHQKEHLPPNGTLAGIPLVALNGQFETFGPASGIDPEYGRETQWVYVRKDVQQFRESNHNYLMSLWVHHGDDHFHGAPELSEYAALFIRKTAQYRLPNELPSGHEPVQALPLKAEDGWLTDSDFYSLRHEPARYAEYKGDKSKALWHYDQEIAEASQLWHKQLGKHQVLDNPKLEWLDEGDGWTFKATCEWLPAWPEKYGGKHVGQPVGHSGTPILFRCKITEPVVQAGPNTFRLMRPAVNKNRSVNIAAFHPGDEQYRSTVRWGSLNMPQVKGQAQRIEFPPVRDLQVGGEPRELKATASSGLPVYYEVDYGPVVIKDGKLAIADVPENARFPIECRVTAYQIGRRVGEAVAPATPASVVFKIVKP